MPPHRFTSASGTSALPDLQFQSLAALRDSFVPWSRTGKGMWLRMGGLATDDARAHGALCNALNRLLGAAAGGAPDALVLDWSGVSNCSAEGLALFGVVVRRLSEAAVRIIVIEPDFTDTQAAIAESRIVDGCGELDWVPSVASKRSSLRCCTRAAAFSGTANESVDDFYDGLSETLRAHDVPRPAVLGIMGTAMELLHNVLSHAGASHAAAAAFVLPRRRPPVLQLGIADDGIGIPSTVLRHPRHEWLNWFSDAGVMRAVIREQLSGREDTDHSLETGGGGMARMIRRLLEETTSEVTLRSGSALIRLSSNDPDQYEIHRLTYGAGTQVRVELRLP
jgi:hypothetical protein